MLYKTQLHRGMLPSYQPAASDDRAEATDVSEIFQRLGLNETQQLDVIGH